MTNYLWLILAALTLVLCVTGMALPEGCYAQHRAFAFACWCGAASIFALVMLGYEH